MNRFWNFKNKSDEAVELHISGDIISDDYAWIYEWFGEPATSPNAFRNEIKKHQGKTITVWIDSNGGDVFAGAGIYNALKEHDGKVIVKITKAMSAASVIAMAGDEIHISPVGIMMIHNPWSKAVGESNDMRHAADILDEVKETILNAYELKTKKSREEIAQLMDDETFMSAKNAVDKGFADKILYTEDEENKEDLIQNSFNFSRLSIQNSMTDSMEKFFQVAKKNQSTPQEPIEPKDSALQAKPETNIANIKKEENKNMTLEEFKANHPELFAQIDNSAKEEGRKEERTRIQNIEKISKNIDPNLVNKAKFEETMDAKDLAFNAMQLNNEKGNQYIKNLEEENNESGVNSIAANVGTDSNANSEKNTVKNADTIVSAVGAIFDKKRRGEK